MLMPSRRNHHHHHHHHNRQLSQASTFKECIPSLQTELGELNIKADSSLHGLVILAFHIILHVRIVKVDQQHIHLSLDSRGVPICRFQNM